MLLQEVGAESSADNRKGTIYQSELSEIPVYPNHIEGLAFD